MKAEGFTASAVPNRPAAISEDEGYITVREVARRSSMSERTIRNMIKDDALPHYRRSKSGKIYLRWADFAGWMECRRIELQGDDCLLDVLRDLTKKARQ